MNISLAEQSHIKGLAHIVKTTFHLACPEDFNHEGHEAHEDKAWKALN